jgi:ABC-type transport system involved in multi-copper enzyme maturation permease subunit
VIWLAWRQHRQQALAGAIGLGLVAVFLLLTHAGIASNFRSSGLQSCLASPGRDCGQLSDQFDQQYRGLQFLAALFLVIPVLVGLFWGAPLVAREIEQGTYRLVWTQSVTRTRWYWTKLALIAGTVAVGAAAFAELVTWWSAIFVRVHDNRFTPGIFDFRGIVPIAYVLFGLALGVLVGTLVRRTLPAMAATLGGFIAVRVLVDLFVRPHYMAAKTATSPVLVHTPFGIKFGSPTLSGAWIVNQQTVDRFGHVIIGGSGISFDYLNQRCPGVTPPPIGGGRSAAPSNPALAHCLHRLGVHTVTSYQPATRFWAFQGIEFAIYAVLAAALLVTAGWIVRRRLA